MIRTLLTCVLVTFGIHLTSVCNTGAVDFEDIVRRVPLAIFFHEIGIRSVGNRGRIRLKAIIQSPALLPAQSSKISNANFRNRYSHN